MDDITKIAYKGGGGGRGYKILKIWRMFFIDGPLSFAAYSGKFKWLFHLIAQEAIPLESLSSLFPAFPLRYPFFFSFSTQSGNHNNFIEPFFSCTFTRLIQTTFLAPFCPKLAKGNDSNLIFKTTLI